MHVRNNDNLWYDWLVNDGDAIVREDLSKPVNKRAYWILNHLKNKPIKTILDVGCGVGVHVNFLNSMGYNIKGIDISPAAISIAKNKFPHLIFEEQDVEELDEKEAYDAVLALTVLITVKDVEKALENIFRASKKYVYVVALAYKNHPTHLRLFNEQSIRDLLERYGHISVFKNGGDYFFIEVIK